MKSHGRLNQARTLLLAACGEPSTRRLFTGHAAGDRGFTHARRTHSGAISVGAAGATGIVSQREAEPVCCGAAGGLRIQNRARPSRLQTPGVGAFFRFDKLLGVGAKVQGFKMEIPKLLDAWKI